MRLSLPVVLALLAATASVSWCAEEAGRCQGKTPGRAARPARGGDVILPVGMKEAEIRFQSKATGGAR